MSEQITITVRTKNSDEVRLLHNTQQTLLDTLREGGLMLPSFCGMKGVCGRCIVRFWTLPTIPSQADRKWLTPNQLREGYRLACLAKPFKDCTVETAFPQERVMSAVAERTLYKPGRETKRGEDVSHRTFVAADIGTTTIVMQLIAAADGSAAETYTCLNPQRMYGTDVMTRIGECNAGKGNILKALIQDALCAGIEKLCAAAEKKGLERPEMVSAACNTAMAHMLLGLSTEGLGKSPFSPVSTARADLIIAGLRVTLMPGISAFAGGDLTAGLYACAVYKEHIAQTEEKWMFLDLGTNAEMAVGNGQQIICTAAAAGPAFESGTDKQLHGSEGILAVCELLETGIADSTGLLKEPYFKTGMMTRQGLLTQKDMRDIQMAKAAVRTGIHLLTEKAEWSGCQEIDRVYLAGGFGFYLDEAAAVKTGILPGELREKVITVGNTSLAGACRYGRALLGYGMDVQQELLLPEKITSSAKVFNMAEEVEFEHLYIEFMNFES